MAYDSEIILGLIIAFIIFILVYLFMGGFDSNRINKDGYSTLNTDKYNNNNHGLIDFFIGIFIIILTILKIIGILLIVGLIIWAIVAFPIAAIIILLILILLK